jgi:hypothetical protein
MLLMSNLPHTFFREGRGKTTKKDSLPLSEVWSTQIQAKSVLRLGQQRPTRTQTEVVLGLEHKV